MYTTLKSLHLLLAAITVAGFLLRAAWMTIESALLRHPVTRIVPHVLDAAFLASGIALIALTHTRVLESPWLLAKFCGLVVYIAAGMVALRFGRTRQQRLLAVAVAVAAFAYVVGAALGKSVLSWFALLS